ncbi:hypothetical protein GCM10009069_19770 [Algimonas arctica]|uniref:Uncharacterized protein n=1 Tax=Algimonas arctica TaxID=1479486 RepID=A0A8J3G2T1_9PROT|nr:hypothetical protein [Algimonas arctica]GHA96778.1 hypothetical protein GCM10009069_19770 [Algimonas arctica]
MNSRFVTTALLLTASLALAPTASHAATPNGCEVVVSSEVVDAEGGRMTVASYRPADNFLSGVYDANTPLTLKEDGAPIRGIICARNDLVPTEKDYAMLATGIPLSLSQNFDSADSDILTVYFRAGAFTHKYTSDYPMSPEFETAVQTQLADFSHRDHGLINPK